MNIDGASHRSLRAPGDGTLSTSTQWLAGTIGVLILAAGVIATFMSDRDTGAAALVVCGLLIAIIAFAGRVPISVKGPGGTEVDFVAARVEAGENEQARTREAEVRIEARRGNTFYADVLKAVDAVAERRGFDLCYPDFAELLPVVKHRPETSSEGQAPVRVAVDIRAGTGFHTAEARRFYRALLEPPDAPYTGVLVIVNADAAAREVRSLYELDRPFAHRLEVVAWRVSDNALRLDDALRRCVGDPPPPRPGARPAGAVNGAAVPAG